ncbi:MAG: hypothetical protein HZB65_00925 [Candidatus Aenigmarchaeota archaeon]|nr:hypothetical protein [Candidatus Aenigmarchaeota archaeon]
MRKEVIERLVKSGDLRPRWKDTERIKSMIMSAERNVAVVRSIKLTDESATVVFRDIYESIRQLGDARWWLVGYEPCNHEISLDILKDMDIKDKIKLNSLNRFKKIRHDANYRGFMVSVSQANEIIDFWDSCGKEIVKILSEEVR